MVCCRSNWAFLLFPESFEHLLLSPTNAKSSAKRKGTIWAQNNSISNFWTIFSFTLALNVNLRAILKNTFFWIKKNPKNNLILKVDIPSAEAADDDGDHLVGGGVGGGSALHCQRHAYQHGQPWHSVYSENIDKYS
mgnify:CR=1 FL=1